MTHDFELLHQVAFELPGAGMPLADLKPGDRKQIEQTFADLVTWLHDDMLGTLFELADGTELGACVQDDTLPLRSPLKPGHLATTPAAQCDLAFAMAGELQALHAGALRHLWRNTSLGGVYQWISKALLPYPVYYAVPRLISSLAAVLGFWAYSRDRVETLLESATEWVAWAVVKGELSSEEFDAAVDLIYTRLAKIEQGLLRFAEED